MAQLYQYKVQDKSTKKFWNGNLACCVFNDAGMEWFRESECLDAISSLVNFRSKWNKGQLAFNPDQWEIVKYRLEPIFEKTSSITDHCNHLAILNELAANDGLFAAFASVMQKKNVLKDIEYLILLKTDGKKARMDVIKEGREQLRLLGVKTRTFREHKGVFGMMDRAQALKARMTLDVDKIVDLAALREKYSKSS